MSSYNSWSTHSSPSPHFKHGNHWSLPLHIHCLSATLKRYINHASPTTSRAYNISGQISFILITLPQKNFLTTMMTFVTLMILSSPESSGSTTSKMDMVDGFRTSLKFPFNCSISPVQVSSSQSKANIAWVRICFQFQSYRMVGQNLH